MEYTIVNACCTPKNWGLSLRKGPEGPNEEILLTIYYDPQDPILNSKNRILTTLWAMAQSKVLNPGDEIRLDCTVHVE